MYVLGLDISTSVVGYSLFSRKGKLLTVGYIDLKKFKTLNTKAEEFEDKLKLMLSKHMDQIPLDGEMKVMIEAPLLTFSKFSNANTLAKLQAFNGIISYLMFTLLEEEPEHISAAKARKLVCGKVDRKNMKEKVFALVRSKEKKVQWPKTRTGNFRKECMDMADAYIVGRAYFSSKSK